MLRLAPAEGHRTLLTICIATLLLRRWSHPTTWREGLIAVTLTGSTRFRRPLESLWMLVALGPSVVPGELLDRLRDMFGNDVASHPGASFTSRHRLEVCVAFLIAAR